MEGVRITAKRLCKNCKHLETDGMFGIFCGVGGDNTKYDCPKYEGISTMTAKRFMVDDCGTLIDMHTRDTFDYVSDVCDLLNEQHETIQRLKQNIDELLTMDIEEELLEENKQLKRRLMIAEDKVKGLMK